MLGRLRLLVPEPTLLRIADDGLMLRHRGVPFNGWRWIELHGAGILTGVGSKTQNPPKTTWFMKTKEKEEGILNLSKPMTQMTVTAVDAKYK